ncbi:conserved hypothetical protein [Methanospirillum hungatei JF-1]|uniref:Zinc-binding protein n=1 Tax=Methanospirillum hungatei JF-1 (strain ATCC 27890 / DSM 864 / NBRC 100397 / JF-1) TaxID=323259 RepID=Q2FNW7_METHJ|nr:putative zinc-binding protein [Methanospirillum hungatei]ABD41066.1 conserved hypothetical protein [Methanospirillum hungatei JF-1]
MNTSTSDTKNNESHGHPSNEPGSKTGSDHIIIPCCGQANTGQISNEVAMVLSDEGFGMYYCTALLATKPEVIISRMQGTEKIIAIDGCTIACAKKIALQAGFKVNHHVLVTDLGIEKKKGRNFTSEQVACVIDVIRKGC